MISSYRLGDLVLLSLNEDEQNLILNEHPNSFGSKFILERNKNKKDSNIDIITKIVTDEIENKTYLLPEDIENCTVIHVRLGDVVAGNNWYEKYKRPFDVNYLKSILTTDTNKKYIIGKCHFGQPSSNNYDKCLLFSQKYLHDAVISLNANHFDSGNADIDLCCAIKAKLFVQGRGYFSQLIVDIRKKLNLPNIVTQCVINDKPHLPNNNHNNNHNKINNKYIIARKKLDKKIKMNIFRS